MKITIEDRDFRLGAENPYVKHVYGEDGDVETARDWNYIFSLLCYHLHYLYLKSKTEDGIVKEITLAKKKKLEDLLEKYKNFYHLTYDVEMGSL